MKTHRHTHTRCASSGDVIDGVSVLVATVQVLSAGLVCVRSMTAGRPLILTHTHIDTQRELRHIVQGQGSYTNVSVSKTHIDVSLSLFVYITGSKRFVSITHAHAYTHSHPYTHLVLRLQGGACCQAPVVHRYLGRALMPAVCWWTLACLQGPLDSMGQRQTETLTHIYTHYTKMKHINTTSTLMHQEVKVVAGLSLTNIYNKKIIAHLYFNPYHFNPHKAVMLKKVHTVKQDWGNLQKTAW